MLKSDTFANAILKMIYNATPIANVADNAATAPLTNIYVGLHTADPGPAGNQSTAEATYTSYARVAVPRTTGGWVVTGRNVSPAATIGFPTPTGGTVTLTHWSTGSAATGTGSLFHTGVIGSVQGPFTATTADVITIPGHTFVVDDRVAFYAAGGSTLPTGITEGTLYWVKTVTGNDITISTTQGGATLDVTAAGDGLAFRCTPLVITTSPAVTPQLAATTVIPEL
jgi:hypothetical protein